MQLPTVAPSEQVFSPQTTCVWQSGLYVARAFDPSIPATKAEVLALAADSGVPGGGSGNFTKLAVGMKKRYGLVGVSYPSSNIPAMRAAVLAAASAGPVAIALAGDQINLTPHWQGKPVGHAIAVFYQHGTTGIQLDPLAPAGYAGDPFTPAELTAYGRAALIFTEPKEPVVVITIEKFPARRWNITASDAAPAVIEVHDLNLTSGFMLARKDTWTRNSGASADQKATVGVQTYLRVVDGGYAGRWVREVPGKVALTEAPKPITQADVDSARAGGRAAGIKAAADAAAAAK